jgi:ribosomal protein S18 acetylase RimI-like enzyme
MTDAANASDSFDDVAARLAQRISRYEIRAAVPADAEAVADYHDRCFRDTYSAQMLAGEFGAPDISGIRQQLHDWFLCDSEVETLVAVADGAPIGHVAVSGHQLLHLFVDPRHQHGGLGRQLLALGEAMIAANGNVDYELHARVENVAAIAFYERAGWVVTGRTLHTVEYGISYDELVLTKHSPSSDPST